ncbi:MAG: hypothetical protein AAB900_02475, partial [Patescibacteria group bacterium]
LPTITKPKIDCLAVTAGPGLEPTLWVGINLAKALSLYWDIPLLPVNHLEGHLVSPLLIKNQTIKFPALAVIISGGHTEMVLAKKFGDYKIIGQTRDDAVGEAFDKVARLLGLPYPGGPEISRYADMAQNPPAGGRRSSADKTSGSSASHPQKSTFLSAIVLPRPMINSKDYDFSFSGLKTAVLYLLPKLGELTEEIKASVALEFETAVSEVLLHKTLQAAKAFKAKTIIVGGGVIANKRIRATFQQLTKSLSPRPSLLLPATTHTGDNATMIAAAAYLNLSARGRSALGGKKSAKFPSLASGQKIKANGNLSLAKRALKS